MVSMLPVQKPLATYSYLDDGQPLAIRWLKDLKGVVGTCDPTLHSMPECLDELEDWAYVRAHEPKSGGGRQLFYKDIANGMTPVTIVVYGCVKEASLAPLGDWTGCVCQCFPGQDISHTSNLQQGT